MNTYTEQWKSIRRLERFTLAWFLVGLCLLLVVALLASSAISSQPSALRKIEVFSYLGIWGAGCLYLRMRVGSFKCPRCGSSFDKNSLGPRKTCSNCGLKRYADA